jgi:hypothetical protein
MLGQLLVLLPAFFFAWYETLVWLVPLLAGLLDPLLHLCWPTTFVKIQAAGSKLVVIVRLAAEAVSAGQAHKGVVLNPFTYSYGIPLFAALAIASTASSRQHLVRLLVGLGVLAAGVCLSILASLLFMFQFDAGFERLQLLGSAPANDTLVRYLHFLGFQILPRVLPIALWILLYRDWLGQLIRPAANGEAGSPTTPAG